MIIPAKGIIGNLPMHKGTLNFLIESGCVYLSLIRHALMTMNTINIIKLEIFAAASMSTIKTNTIDITAIINIEIAGVLLTG